MVRRERPRPSNNGVPNKRRKRSACSKPDLYTFLDCPELQDAPELCQKVKESLTDLATYASNSAWATPEPIKILDWKYSSNRIYDEDSKPPVLAFDEEEPPQLLTLGDHHLITEEEPPPSLESSDHNMWLQLQPRKVFAFDGKVGFVGVYNEQKQTYDITWP